MGDKFSTDYINGYEKGYIKGYANGFIKMNEEDLVRAFEEGYSEGFRQMNDKEFEECFFRALSFIREQEKKERILFKNSEE